MLNFTSSYNLFSLITGVLLWLTAPLVFSQTKQEVYDRINHEREARGLKPVSVCKRLERSAQSWAFFMPYSLRHNVNFLKRFRRTGAECLTIGADPVDSWLKSKSHRQCILGSSVTAMGLGHYRGKWVWRSFTN